MLNRQAGKKHPPAGALVFWPGTWSLTTEGLCTKLGMVPAKRWWRWRWAAGVWEQWVIGLEALSECWTRRFCLEGGVFTACTESTAFTDKLEDKLLQQILSVRWDRMAISAVLSWTKWDLTSDGSCPKKAYRRNKHFWCSLGRRALILDSSDMTWSIYNMRSPLENVSVKDETSRNHQDLLQVGSLLYPPHYLFPSKVEMQSHDGTWWCCWWCFWGETAILH